MKIKAVESPDIIKMLDINNPSWYMDFADKRELKSFIKYRNTDALKRNVLQRNWIFCIAVYQAIVAANK